MDSSPPPREAAPPPTPTHPPRVAPIRAAGHPRAGRVRPRRRRNAAARAAVLLALVGLTAWNFTRSDALDVARDAEARGDDTQAVRAALDHLDRRPWSRDAERLAARALSRLDHAELAEPHYRRAGPLSTEDRLYRAYGLTRANLRDRAVAAYREVLAERPDDVTALRLLAGVLLSQSRWDDVLAAADRLAHAPPGPADALTPVTTPNGRWTFRPVRVESVPAVGYTLKGTVYRDMLEAETSAQSFERVLELDPGLRSMPLPRAMFWNYLGESVLRSGRSADAVRYLEPVADALNDAAVLDVLGQAYVQQASFDEARRCFRKALELDPNRVGSWQNLGRLELQLNQADEAVRLLSKADALSPHNYETVYSLGLAYRRLGRDDQARRLVAEADRLRRRLKPKPGGMGAMPGRTSP